MTYAFVPAAPGTLIAEFVEPEDFDDITPLECVFYMAPVAWQVDEDHVPIPLGAFEGHDGHLTWTKAFVLPDGRAVDGDGVLHPSVAEWAGHMHAHLKSERARKQLKELV